MVKINNALIVFSIFITLFLNYSKGDINTKLEPHYAQSILAYHAQDYATALHLVDGLLKHSPNTPEFIELKALILQIQSHSTESAALYEQLIQLKTTRGASATELAPYYFSLGVIHFKENHFGPASNDLNQALTAKFNVESAHFFLGMIAFKTEHWTQAADHFSHVIHSTAKELLPVAEFYQGQVYLQLGLTTSATQNFFAASQIAEEQLNDPESSPEILQIAKQIEQATSVALKPFDQNNFFGGLSLLTSYDSNVLLQGSGNTSSGASSSPTQASTAKNTLLASIGYSTSPLKTFQLIPIYKTAFNLNWNADTRAGEYFLHDFTLYITRHALARWSYGFKLEGIYTLQDQVDLDHSRHFSPFSIAASVGPFFRYTLTPTLIAALEINITPQNYYGDATTSSNSKKSGVAFNAKFALKQDQGHAFWNPGGFLLLEHNDAEGYEYKYGGFTAELNNTLRPFKRLSVNMAIDASHFQYNRDGNDARDDWLWMIDLNHQYKLTSQVNLLGEFQWTWDQVKCNDPNVIGLFQYNRFVASVGINYVF